MYFSGRYMLVLFRELNATRAEHGQPPMDLAVTRPPSGGFLNTDAVTRCAAVYAGSKHRAAAVRFLQFLASRDYGEEIIRDGDALPPNPAFARSPLFLHPPDHAAEGDLNRAFADAENGIAIGASYSPFVLQAVVAAEDSVAKEAYLNDLLTAEGAARQVTDRLNAEIDRTLAENPAVRPQFDQLVRRQAQIDALRAAGEPAPLAWTTDPYYRRAHLTRGRAHP